MSRTLFLSKDEAAQLNFPPNTTKSFNQVTHYNNFDQLHLFYFIFIKLDDLVQVHTCGRQSRACTQKNERAVTTTGNEGTLIYSPHLKCPHNFQQSFLKSLFFLFG